MYLQIVYAHVDVYHYVSVNVKSWFCVVHVHVNICLRVGLSVCIFDGHVYDRVYDYEDVCHHVFDYWHVSVYIVCRFCGCSSVRFLNVYFICCVCKCACV